MSRLASVVSHNRTHPTCQAGRLRLIAALFRTKMDFTADRGPGIIAAVSVSAVISTVFLILRVYCKLYRHRRLWWDDYVLGISWVSGSRDSFYGI